MSTMNQEESLKSITRKLRLESEEDDLLKDFYIPTLEKAIKYDRMAGFFNSSSLAIAVDGFSKFFTNFGMMRIICCAVLDKKDAESINDGETNPSKIIDQTEYLSLDTIKNEIIKNRMKILSWLVSKNRLKIKIAFFKNTEGKIMPYAESKVLQHAKVGIMEDKHGNKISFSGSVNESARGWGKNIEEFKIFRSWEPVQNDYLKLDEGKFREYWESAINSVELITIPKAIEKKLIEFAPKNEMETNDAIVKLTEEKMTILPEEEISTNNNSPKAPKRLKWRKHQEIAINNWMKQNGKGIFKMATGAGKTKAALGVLTKLYETLEKNDKLPLATIMVCPYQHLVKQWEDECIAFNIKPLLCFKNKKKWEKELKRYIRYLDNDIEKFLPIIVTNSTYVTETFQNIICSLRSKALIICDEAHNLGAENVRKKLLDRTRFRLALSATFERKHDEEGTEVLKDYFGNVCLDFGIKEAIENGCLCKYDYFPELVELTDEESQEYYNISKLISIAIQKEKKIDFNNHKVKNLLIKRSRILAKAENKFTALRKLFSEIEDYSSVKNTLVFCGDGRIECKTDQTFIRQVERVTQLLGNEFSLRVRSYTHEDSYEDRRKIANSFEQSKTQVLVAIRCP